ncbi:MAG TPA: ubiquitin-like domain-containing protein [Clostridiales bacterium]|nr:ubiquitin-like domain-containing protein [Clostridiales bacterium]
MIGTLSLMKGETKAKKLKIALISITSFLTIITLSVVVAAAMSVYDVTIADSGEEITVSTRKTQATQILEQEGISLGEYDFLDESEFVAGENSKLTVYRAFETTLNDNGIESKITACRSVAHTLDLNDIKLGAYDEIEPNLASAVEEGITLTIKRAFGVSVLVGGTTKELNTVAVNVKDVLNKLDITLDEDDETIPAPEALVEPGMKIEVLRVENKQRTVEEVINFQKKVVKSSKMYVGESKITQEGVNGLKEVVYQDRSVNGEYEKTSVLSENVIKSPVTQITTVGTMIKISKIRFQSGLTPISDLKVPDDVKLDENGLPVNYKRIVDGKASAYCEDGGRRTASGRPAMPGHVAVNPNQFPYGTRLYIVSHDGKYLYGYSIAADTGSFTKWENGPIVDLFFNSEAACRQFGVRNVRIYVLD